MAKEILAKAGIYFDELNKVRVMEPQSGQLSTELKEDCETFTNKISQFQTAVDSFITLFNDLSQQVEKEKMKAIGSRNFLKSMAKQKEAEELQLQSLIREKQVELERLRVQYETLMKEQADQKEFLQQFLVDR